MMKPHLLIVTGFAILILAACGQTKKPYQTPPATDDGWITASIADVGMDKEPIDAMLDFLATKNQNPVNSVFIVKDGKLVLERYYPGLDIKIDDDVSFSSRKYDRDTLHFQASASKSITSILFGLAVDQGLIMTLDEGVFDSFPQYASLATDGKEAITLRHLLSMTAGLAWDEGSYSYDDQRNDLNQMLFSSDPARYLLEKPLVSAPGEEFLYNSGITNLLGFVVQQKTGEPLVEFAGENLFQPLGITEYEWQGYPMDPESAVASSLLFLKPRDMARIGQLFLQEGVWNGQQIISADWVRESTSEVVALSKQLTPTFRETGYGYQWWRGQFSNGETDVFFAAGWGGQFIFIVPQFNMVVVLTGSAFDDNYTVATEIVNRYILGSLIGYPAGGEAMSYGVTLTVPAEYEKTIAIYSKPGLTYPVVGEVEKGVAISITGWDPQNDLSDSWLQISPSQWVTLVDVDIIAQRASGVGGSGIDKIWLQGNLANLPVIRESSLFKRLWPAWLMLPLGLMACLLIWCTRRRRN